MHNQDEPVQQLKDIRQMMERSSRFISLSGLSGISAGICALIGAWLAYPYVVGSKDYIINADVAIAQAMAESYSILLNTWLFWIAMGTLLAALLTAFLFTWLKSKKDGTPIWGTTARRLIMQLSIPLIAGGIFIFKILEFEVFGMVAPGCLIFYGLALINASKYTLPEIRWLGYCQLLLGLISCWFIGYGIFFWAMGFGIMHIIYGIYMWKKYGG